jgi:hypothetical protein
MKKLFRSFQLLQIIILLLTIASCEAPESHKKRSASERKIPETIERNITPLVYRGMLSVSGEMKLQDCSSGKLYVVSDKSDLSSIEKAIAQTQDQRNMNRLYIEAEGFVSTQENPAKKQNDTVLVIGRISRIDMQFDCNPQ